MSELAIAAAMATTPTTTTSPATPVGLRLLGRALVRRSPGLAPWPRVALGVAARSGAARALRLSAQPGAAQHRPCELLKLRGGPAPVRALGCWGPSRRHSPRGPEMKGERARKRATVAGEGRAGAAACARPLRPEDTVPVQVARVGVWRHPRPGAARRGPAKLEGGGSAGAAGGRPGARAAAGRRGAGGAGCGGVLRPRPGPSEAPTSPCNFLAWRSGKVGPSRPSDGAQTGNGVASWRRRRSQRLQARQSKAAQSCRSLHPPEERDGLPGGRPLPLQARPAGFPPTPARPTHPPTTPSLRLASLQHNTCRGICTALPPPPKSPPLRLLEESDERTPREEVVVLEEQWGLCLEMGEWQSGVLFFSESAPSKDVGAGDLENLGNPIPEQKLSTSPS